MKPLNIMYVEPSYSSLSIMSNSVPIALSELGHTVFVMTEGDLPRGMDASGMDLWRQWMEDNQFQIMWNIQCANFDLFFSRRGDKIPIKAVDFVRSRGVRTLNWDMEDVYPDQKRDYLEVDFAPTYWEKTRHYHMVVGGCLQLSPWMPYAVYGEKFFCEQNTEKKFDVGFSGGTDTPMRKAWLEKFKNMGVVVFKGGSRVDYNKFLSQCKIIINRHNTGTTNGRIFETTAAGSLLITDYVPGLEKLFDIGKEIVVYKKDGVDEVKYYLEHDEERERIARAGLERTKKDHRLRDRLEEMLMLAMETDDRVMWEKFRTVTSSWDRRYADAYVEKKVKKR